MEVVQDMVDKLTMLAAVESFVCPLCKRYIIPKFTVTEDDILLDTRRKFYRDEKSKLVMVCCEDCANELEKRAN